MTTTKLKVKKTAIECTSYQYYYGSINTNNVSLKMSTYSCKRASQ